MKRVLILAGVLLGLGALSAPAGAQGIARGKIVDSQGHGIPDVTVVLEFQGERTQKFEVKTNDHGEFMQGGLFAGLYRFTASKEGYRATYLDERVDSSGTTLLPDILLKSRDEIAREQGLATSETMKQFAEAIKLVNAEKYDEAVAAFQKILEDAPNVPEAHQNLAYVYAKKEDWKNAEACYLKAIELRPDDPALKAGLAAVYVQEGRQEEADALMGQASADNPQDASVVFNRAVYLANTGKIEEAIAEFEHVLSIDPAYAMAHFHLGTLLVGQGKIPEAIEHLETYLSMNPSNQESVATAKALIETLKK